jgi:8-amino-7-oxononanoate synthase
VAGHFAIHEQAEQALADFCGSEAALLFSSGYAANQAVITSLVGRGMPCLPTSSIMLP